MKAPLLLLLAAAGNCSAQVYTNTFNSNPPLGGNDPGGSSPGLWYVDRKAPATFASASFGGGSSLDLGVSAGDFSGTPGGSFSDTQGRKYYLTSSGVGSFVSAQLYIPSAWQNQNVSPGLWLTIYDNSGQAAGFPIIGFYSDGTGNSGGSYFRVWDDVTGYVNLGTAINWNAWNTFQFTFAAGGIVDSINGTDVLTDTAAVANGGTSIANVMIESKNFGTSYDAYWDNLITPSPTIGAVPEPSSVALLALGGALLLRIRKFSRARRNKTVS
jgi:PEP-CTERM motif